MSLKLTEKLKKKLKKPFGKLCHKIKKEKFLITVGDRTSITAIENNILPNLMIYDGKIMRKKTASVEKKLDAVLVRKIKISNPKSTISEESWAAITEGLKKKTKIKVSGEEDLLVLPCIQLAKKNSVIYYGQPNKGLVKIIVTKAKKEQTNKIIRKMEVI